MSVISNALFMKSLCFLPLEDIASCPSVSKRWHAVCSDNILWKLIAASLQIPLSSPKKARKTLVQIVHCQRLGEQDILTKIESFLMRTSLEQNGKFTCFFSVGKGNQEKLEIVIKGSRCNLPGVPRENQIDHLSKFAIVERYFSTKAYPAHLPQNLEEPPPSREIELLRAHTNFYIPIEERVYARGEGPYQAMVTTSGFRSPLTPIVTLLEKRLSDFSVIAQNRPWKQAVEGICSFAMCHLCKQALPPLNGY